MARSARIQILLIYALAAAPVALGQPEPPRTPQNSDLSILAGPVFGSSQVVGPTGLLVKVTGVFSFQSDFAHTIHAYSFAELWFEFPSTSASRESGNVGSGVSSISYSEFYVTPGLRLHFPVSSRVSLYGAVGGGYGSFDATQYYGNSGGHSQSNTNYHGVFDFGGGVDFRLTRLLSLRGDLRDFVTGKALGGVGGRNHVLIQFGVAAHF